MKTFMVKVMVESPLGFTVTYKVYPDADKKLIESLLKEYKKRKGSYLSIRANV